MRANRGTGHLSISVSTMRTDPGVWRPVGSDEKRPYIQRLFTDIAPRYDWFNRLASCGFDARWRAAALRWAQLEPTHTVLDVCTGTGDLALLAVRRQGGQGHVVGIDMNGAMLHWACHKAERQAARIGWIQADAEALPFPTGSFDRVLIGFSTRNLTNLMAGIREMVRVLRPGGQLVILETGRPANPLVRWGHQLFLMTGARIIGLFLTGRLWPFTYLARSVQTFLSPDAFREHLQRAQTTVQYVPLSHGLASLYIATK